MPDAAIKTGCVDFVTSLESIPRQIMNACED
jgi:chemotaxis response regulator CheB